MTAQFLHLGLRRWPFPVVPDREYCTFMADRERLQVDLADLLANLSRRETSSIHLFWAWFGAGKTHTLLYLANRAEQASQKAGTTSFVTVYSEFPKSPRGFLDLFRTFAVGLDPDKLVEAYLEVRTCPDANALQRKLVLASPDLANALQVLAMGDSQKQITATRWLRAEALPASQLRTVGVSRKIDSPEEAVRILVALVELYGSAARARRRPGNRVLWLLDEFQRIERCSPKVRDEINTGLHSTFNACPNELGLFLSFSGNPQEGFPPWFSRELRDRIGRTKTMVLPPMDADEALKFVKDILAEFRLPDFKASNPYFPFTEESVSAILSEVAKVGELRPRAVMHAMSAVLEEADRLIERRELSYIVSDFALQALRQRAVVGDDEES